jgi:parvulin-like peptidyl-prolyl isomerase
MRTSKDPVMNTLPAPRASASLGLTTRHRAAIAAFCLSLLASTGSSVSQAQDPVIARIDGTEIRQSDLRMAEEDIGKAFPPQQDEKTKREFLITYLTDIVLLSKVAQSRNVGDEAELQRRMEFTRQKALMEKLLQVAAQTAVTDESVRQAYDEAVQKVQPEPELRLRAMLFKFKGPDDKVSIRAAEAKAKNAIRLIAKGAEFSAVAKKLSENPSGRNNGGDMGFLTRAQMGKEFADVAFAIPRGTVSPPIFTPFGWHVITVEDERSRQAAAFEAVRDQFASLVARRAQLELIAKVRSSTTIERLDQVDKANEPTATDK